MTDVTRDRADLRTLFEHHLAVGLHHGAQLAVYRDGERVLDLAGGETGPDGDPVTGDTRFLLWSCTKPYTAACVHHLADRGLLDYDDPVREHWPEFAEAGTRKATVTVRHVLSHQAGLQRTAIDDRFDLWTDWTATVGGMEAAEPAFEPGSTAAYHGMTFGWILGELVRRVAGVAVDEYAREHVFDPLGMDRTAIGLPEDEADDVATIVGYEEFDRCRRPEIGMQDVDNENAAMLFNDEAMRRALVPAANGIGTARDLARFFACLEAGGELDGTRILSADAVERATALQVAVEEDATLGVPRRYAMGFERGGLPTDKYGSISPPSVVGHGGLGSVAAWADPEAGLALAYVTNGIRDEFEHVQRVATISDAVRTVLG